MCRATKPFTVSSTKVILPSVSSSLKQHHTAAAIISHNYHDRCEESSTVNPDEWMRVKSSPSSPFPVKLYDLLERIEQDCEYDDQGALRGVTQAAISWQPHGRCFMIHNSDELVKTYLPRYMKSSKLASFQRQLNLYGFNRITQGTDKGAYYHEYFLKGHGPLTLQIQRIKVKGTGVRGKSNPLQEPNLWKMPWVGTKMTSSQQLIQQQQCSSLIRLVEQTMAVPLQQFDICNTTRNEQDTIFVEWGMPFYALDYLPQEPQETPKTINNDQDGDSPDLDIILSAMLSEDQHQQQQRSNNNRIHDIDDSNDEPLPQNCKSSYDDIDLLDMLQRIVTL